MRTTMLALLVASIAVESAGCSDAADDSLQKSSATEPCTHSDLANGHLLVTRTFERDTKKPITATIEFSHAVGESLCVLVVTGGIGVDGGEVRPAMASLEVTLDGSTPIALPKDFNAHPQYVTRRLDPDTVTDGPHSLAVTLNGKPGSTATVAVVGISGSSGPFISTVTRDRLADPDRPSTTVVDEVFATTNLGTTKAQVQAELGQLPFPAWVIGQVGDLPAYQIYIPGASASPAGVSPYAESIGALPSLRHAEPHYAGVVSAAHDVHNNQPARRMPDDGNDSLYAANGAFTPGAWHLSSIEADYAWHHQTAGVPVAVLDNGFNLDHPDLQGKMTCTSATGDCEPAEDWDACSDPDSVACNKLKECFGEKPGKSHGTAVAGLIAATGNTSYAVGVSWDAPLFVNSWRSLAPIKTLPDDLEKKYGEGVPIPTMHYLVALHDFTQQDPELRVINESFGTTYYCQGGKSIDEYWPGAQADNIRFARQHGEMAAIFLAGNRHILLVMAAGNNGEKDIEAYKSGSVCAFHGPIFFEGTETDPTVAKQALCVAASNKYDNAIEGYSNHGGDPVAAPVGNHWWSEDIGTLSYSPMASLLFQEGTSLAAPQVSGVASLAFGANKQLSPAHVRAMIVDLARPIASYKGYAYGVLDAHAVVAQAEDWQCDGYVPKQDGDGRICPSFWDVTETHWSYGSVQQLACDCVLKGYDDGSFLPDNPINRAEMLKVVVEATFPQSEIKEFEGVSTPFSDVTPPGVWYEKYVALGYAKGIVMPAGNEFEPSKSVNRAEAVAFLTRAAAALLADGIAAPDGSLFEDLAQSYEDLGSMPSGQTFPDVAPGDWFYTAAEAAAAVGIVCGHDADQDPATPKEFLPASNLTRAEASHVMCLTRYGHGGKCSPSACAD